MVISNSRCGIGCQLSIVSCQLPLTIHLSRITFHPSPIPMPHFQADGLVLIDLLLHDDELARADLLEQALMDIFLDHALAEFFAEPAQLLVRVARTRDTD